MKKTLSIFLCMMITMMCTLTPMVAMASNNTPANPTQEDTTKPTNKPTDKPTNKPTEATTKKTTRKTTAAPSKTGKLSVSSKRSTEGSGEGGKVNVIYTVENTGDVTAKNIKIKDPDIGGSKTVGEIPSLEPGDSKSITYEATMTRESTSTPTVTCTMSGSSRTFTGEPVKISLTGTSSSLSATLTSASTDVQPNTPSKFSLLLKNNDTKKISDISVTDHTGKNLKSNISLDANSTTNVEFELTLAADANVFVNVKGKDSDGNDVSSKSNEVAMKVSGDTVAVTDGIAINISADKNQLEKKGTIKLTLVVQNLMSRPYTNIIITDTATGKNLQTIALLSPKDSKSYTSDVEITGNTSFKYSAVATYEDGTAITVQSNGLEVTIQGGGLMGNMTLIIVIIVIVVLLIIATSVTLYILSKKEKEKNKSLGATQSEKYKKTPKKKAPTPVAAPTPQKPISTFTINDQAPSYETTPIQIPKGNAFDEYGNGDLNDGEDAFGSGGNQDAFGTNQQPTYGIDPSEPLGQHSESFNSEPEETQFIPEEQIPHQATTKPDDRKPMDYNDLDPD